MRYDEFLAAVANHGGPADREHADEATRTVLADLGKRLAGNEPRDLAAQLPSEMQQPLLEHNGEQETDDDLDAFLRRVAEHEGRGCDPEQAMAHARAVLSTMAGFVSAGEIADLRSQLPAGFGTLFE
ncbi:DUF2267 domain-containing protein [Janibacter cremeus]|uniref:DUF2267 domain-containing protein n=1 Tax=Janibacter cremeus TaxID=1285192 RepID=UPI0023F7CFDC|nr:DUF2267 domain-containing protein [Janibacter cremeus]WEV77664.1 DUF2267 domain-containing protein [Janibacter cremeus]